MTSKEAKMGKVMRHTLGASLNIRHNLSSSKGPKPLQLKLLTTYIPKTSAFTLAFSTSQRLRTTRPAPRPFFPLDHTTTPPQRNFGPPSFPRPAPFRLPLVPCNGCGPPGRAPERFLPLDITSLLLHVIFDARFLLRQ